MMLRLLPLCLLLAGCLTTLDLEPGECPETDAQMEMYCTTRNFCGANFNSVDGCEYRCSTPCVSETVGLVRTKDKNEILNAFDERVMSDTISMTVDDELFFGIVGISPNDTPIKCEINNLMITPKDIEGQVRRLDQRDVKVDSLTNDLSVNTIEVRNPGEYVLRAQCDQQRTDYNLRVTLPKRTLDGSELPQPTAWMRADSPYPSVWRSQMQESEEVITFWGSELDLERPAGWSSFPTEQNPPAGPTLDPAAPLFARRPALQFSGTSGLQWFDAPTLNVGTVMMAMKIDDGPDAMNQFIIGGSTQAETWVGLRERTTLEVCWSDMCRDEGLAFQGIGLTNAQIHTFAFSQSEADYFISGSNVPGCNNEQRSGRSPFTPARLGYFDDGYNLRGEVAEVLVFDTRLTKEQRFPYERYLSRKYNIMLNNMSAAPCFP